MKRNPFTFLRIFTCIALLALLGGRILTNGPTINLLLFLLLVAFWFVPTLLLNTIHVKTVRARTLSNTLCAVLDSYVLLMATAEAAADIWSKPFLLLGAYVFLASLLGGPIAGAGSAISGFCGLLNGWLTPLGELQPACMLGGAGASAAGFVCGSAWRALFPLVLRTAQQQQQAPAPDAALQAKHELLAGMEARLLEITAERDQARERLRQLETSQTISTPLPPTEKTATTEQPSAATNLPVAAAQSVSPQAYLQQLEAELAGIEAEKTTLTAEKQKLMADISRLSDELMNAFLPHPQATPPETPPAPSTNK